MDMLKREQIAAADLADWRQMAQGLHARFLVDSLTAGARFAGAVAEASDAFGHHPRISLGGTALRGHVDLKLVSTDAIYHDDEGKEHRIEWVTQRDVDLARQISEIAAGQGLRADLASITSLELALDAADAARIAPVWSALLTGNTEAFDRSAFGNDVNDHSDQVPYLWFQKTDEHETPRQRFHLDVWVAPEAADQRIAAAVAAGGTIVDDSNAPSFTVIADRDGNKACVCTSLSRK